MMVFKKRPVSSIQWQKLSKIAKFAHSSISFAEKLEAIGKSIPTANKTRWNSQLHTVQKILEIPMMQLNSILTELKRKELCLSARDLAILNEFVSLLALFGEATDDYASTKIHHQFPLLLRRLCRFILICLMN